jgi:intein/homing endonuclease
VAPYVAESWTLNKDIIKRLADFKEKVLRRTFGGSKIYKNWIKQCNKRVTELFGNLDTLLFVLINRLIWMGHVNRMGSKRKVIQVYHNNLQGSRVRGRPKNDVGTVYVQRVFYTYVLSRYLANRTELFSL